jgi:hypothetical protein
MENPEIIVTASAFDFQRDLGRYWRHVRKQGELVLTQQGWVYKSSFKSVLAALNMPDAPADEQQNGRLWFIRRLLTTMHELSGTHFDHSLRVNTAGRLLSMPMAQRVKWAFDLWRDSGTWNELVRLPIPFTSVDVRRESPPALGKARLALLRTLAKLHTGQEQAWLSPVNLVATMKRNEYPFLFERRHRNNYGGLYTSPYYSPNNPYGITFSNVKDEASGWNTVEAGFIFNLLTGPLHWMGLVELGYAQRGEHGENSMPDAYRLTDTGAWLLGLAPQPQFAESGGKLIVQPNFAVLALEPISDVVLSDLDQFAESQGGERVITYQLTRESMYRGQQAGWDAGRVLAFLEQHQNAPIAMNVRRSLEEWEQSHRRITFHRNKVMVQFADDEAQAESNAALKLFKPHKLSECYELINAHGAGEVVTALRDAGWVPTLHMANDTSGEAMLRATDDGEVMFTQPAPSVFALGRLEQFAESPSPAGRGGGKGGTRITANSVRNAMSAGLSLDQLLATLAELHNGPASEALVNKIRAWATFFGTGKMQQAVLLELSSLDVLSNLMNDKQVGKFLTPIEGSLMPLAIVDAENAEAVRQMLIERGISI